MVSMNAAEPKVFVLEGRQYIGEAEAPAPAKVFCSTLNPHQFVGNTDKDVSARCIGQRHRN